MAMDFDRLILEAAPDGIVIYFRCISQAFDVDQLIDAINSGDD